MTFTRRQTLAALGATSLVSGSLPALAKGEKARLVVIGGGFGGASAARFLKQLIPNADVTLVEANSTYVACPFSNLVIGGERTIDAQSFTHDGLKARGVTIARDMAEAVDPQRRTVNLRGGTILPYDKLVLSPGVDMRWNALEGYDEAAAEIMPHAWKAGAQTLLLRDQLRAMPDNGLVVMYVPPAPFRCPPGPYERACLIAHYLKTKKPQSKLLILDAKDSFSKMPLFKEAWAQHYPDHLEWRGASADGRVSRVDAANMTVSTDFEDIKVDVINVIPPQKAGWIADRAGVADATGWCPIHPVSFQSRLQPDIHVIGDATIANPMPKSAFSANLQAKITSIAIASMLSGEAPEPATLMNTCYSYTTPDDAVSIVGVYSNANDELSSIDGAGGLSPLDADPSVRAREAAQARDWFAAITGEAFG